MPRATTALVHFNRGLVSRYALARLDVKRTALSAQTMVNFVPRVLGSMMLRPGFGYVGAAVALPKLIPFVFATTDTALLEVTDSTMRVWINDQLLSRTPVNNAVTNPDFTLNLAGWATHDEVGAASAWVVGGFLGLTGNGTNYAITEQVLAVNDMNIEHGLRIHVERGPVLLRIGHANGDVGDDSFFPETALATGYHSIAFIPTTVNMNITFKSRLDHVVLVDSVDFEAKGINAPPVVVTIPSPWLLNDLHSIRWEQSADVLFVACQNYQQRRIERRGSGATLGRSWSIVLYLPPDGPFRTENTGTTTIASTALSGDVTLIASKPLWKPTNIGSLWRITSAGQIVQLTAAGNNVFSTPIRVTGIGDERIVSVQIFGTWVGTVTLQRSIGSSTGPWAAVKSWSANTNETFKDGLDNQIIFYRLGTTAYTSGTAQGFLFYSAGSLTGVARITSYTDAFTVGAQILTPLGGTADTAIWSEGLWSDRRGWPTAVALYEGRLWWGGKNGIVGSISDAYDGFDPDFIGDAGPINRTIGSGPVDVINFILPLQRLILGAQGEEHSVRSNTFDEPLTPTNFNIKSASTQGSASVAAVKIDARGVFVQRSATRVYELAFDVQSYDYQATDLTDLVPELCEAGIVTIAVQRQPETRIHCVLADGTVALAVIDKAENVLSWQTITAAAVAAGPASIIDVAVLPGTVGNEDRVYYAIKRTIGGVVKYYIEKWAQQKECRGATLNKQADAFVLYSGVSTSTITGLGHLEGEQVIVWGDGRDLSQQDAAGNPSGYLVAGGAVTFAGSAKNAVVGLPYTATWESAKLAQITQDGTSLAQPKKITKLGLVLADVHSKGLRAGPSQTKVDPLPNVVRGKTVTFDTVTSDSDAGMTTIPGTWDTDSRLWLVAYAPRPVTVLGAVVAGEWGVNE